MVDDAAVKPPPRLMLWLGGATALALLVGAIGILLLVWQRATVTAERGAEQRARLVVTGILAHELRPQDVTQVASPARAAELDALVFAPLRTDSGVVRASLFRVDGTIVYSSTHSLIGQRPTEQAKIETALGGRVSREVSRLNDDAPDADGRKVLEVYVPMPETADRPAAAFEVYEDYALVTAEVRRTLVPLALLLAAIAVAFMGSLFPILRRVTSTLVQRNRDVDRQAHQLRETLAEREGVAAALLESDTRLRLMLRQLPALVITLDTDAQVTSANGLALGQRWNAELKVGRPVADAFGDGDFLAAHRTALAGRSSELEFSAQGRTVSAHVEPLRDVEGAIVGTIALARDVTDEPNADSQPAD